MWSAHFSNLEKCRHVTTTKSHSKSFVIIIIIVIDDNLDHVFQLRALNGCFLVICTEDGFEFN